MSAFQGIAEGRGDSLALAAFECARDEYTSLDISAYMKRLRALCSGFDFFRSIRNAGSEDESIITSLNEYFFAELGFSGATENYYDPRNSFLSDVVDRRIGIPITLSVLYRELAATAGLDLCGINLPGHFVLAYPPRLTRRVYIDVFHGGQRLDWAGCCSRVRTALGDASNLRETDFPPMSDRDILVRMLRNLKGIYSNSDSTRALRIQERLVRLLPNEPAELRDLGLLYSRVGKPILALRTLQELVRQHPNLGEVEFIRDSIRFAAREAALVN